MTSRLHYCELVTALCALAVRGHLVIKMFTLLEHPAICMMYLMYSMFDKVCLLYDASNRNSWVSTLFGACKPALCRHPDNSCFMQQLHQCNVYPSPPLNLNYFVCCFGKAESEYQNHCTTQICGHSIWQIFKSLVCVLKFMQLLVALLYKHNQFLHCLINPKRGHSGIVVTHWPPTPEVSGLNPGPYVGKLVVAYRWSAVLYRTLTSYVYCRQNYPS